MGKNFNDSPKISRGFRFWMLLLVCSALFGTTSALLPLAFPNTIEPEGFDIHVLYARIVIFSCAFLIVFLIASLTFKIFRRFFLWLFGWRNIKPCIIAFALLACLITIIYAEEDFRGLWAWDKFKHEMEAKGEKVDFASYVPAKVPEDQNFALTPIVASCYTEYLDMNGHRNRAFNTNVVDRLQMDVYGDGKYELFPTNSFDSWIRSRKTDLKAWQQFFDSSPATTNNVSPAPQSQSPAADMLQKLSKYDSTIKELRSAAHLPYSRFPLNYNDDGPYGILLPHLAALKRCSQVLQLRALAELNRGQNEKALADVKLILRLIGSVRSEPLLISHLVRLNILRIALQPVWEGVAEHQWTDSQIAEIEKELAGLDFLADYQFVMCGEQAYSDRQIDYMRTHRNLREFDEMFNGLRFADHDAFADNGNGTSMAFIYYTHLTPACWCYLMPSGWYYQNKIAVGRAYQQWFLPMIDAKRQLVSPSIENQARAFWGSWETTPQNILSHFLLHDISGAPIKFAYGQTAVNLARMGCALERYRLARGEYPKTLDALVPQFIDKLPDDVINGDPPKYHRNDDGQFVLYSVGWNETDEGGVVSVAINDYGLDFKKGDWVWRYPAK